MREDSLIPNDPLAVLKKYIETRKVYWTYHVNIRMEDRFIQRKAIIASIETYDIIEMYPYDKYYPSYLVYAKHEDKVLHFLAAIDLKNDNVRIVTVYYPDLHHWENDFKTRRHQ